MKIYSMTATFGKLEQQTLTLQPGLNIIYAPNEWGKSTWCAFLLAMLYGLDTKTRTTKQNLSVKDHFSPWSGSPMAGRIDLNWNGRDITIERTTKGRVPMGAFRAYETQSGLDVPELRADNCGELLVGVEQSVFQRAGFIRMSEMCVTEDESLRQRLNDLVTTGDDSGDAAVLFDGLKSLRSRIIGKNNGLLPRVEQELAEVSEKLTNAQNAEDQLQTLHAKHEEATQNLKELVNHRIHLENDRADRDRELIEQAAENRARDEKKLAEVRTECRHLPPKEILQNALKRLRTLAEEASMIQMPVFRQDERFESSNSFGFIPGHAVEQVHEDQHAFHRYSGKTWLLLILLGIMNCTAGGLIYYFLRREVLSAAVGLLGVFGIWLAAANYIANSKKKGELVSKYGTANTLRWEQMAVRFDEHWNVQKRRAQEYERARREIEQQLDAIRQEREELLGQKTETQLYEELSVWNTLEEAETALRKSTEYFLTLQAIARPYQKTDMADSLSLSEEDTKMQIQELRAYIQELEKRIQKHTYSGVNADDLEALAQKKMRLAERREKLMEYCSAIDFAMQAHRDARDELHRRFSPGIIHLAQTYLRELTEDKYDRILINQDFSIHAGNSADPILRSQLYRSEGTMDQINLSLRLAVSNELTPQAPLVMDDALVRFDNDRLRCAFEILKSIGETKQILLFTCQTRENELLST